MCLFRWNNVAAAVSAELFTATAVVITCAYKYNWISLLFCVSIINCVCSKCVENRNYSLNFYSIQKHNITTIKQYLDLVNKSIQLIKMLCWTKYDNESFISI